MDLRSLLSCFGVAALAVVTWGHVPAYFVREPVRRQIALGVVMGIGAVGAMMFPLHVISSMILDLRGSLICVAAFFGGPLSAVVAAILALAYRLSLSGVGVWAGCINIVVTASIGLVGQRIAAGRPATQSGILLMAASVAITTPLCGLFVPRDIVLAGLPVIMQTALFTFGSTGLIIVSVQRNERLRKLFAQNAIYRAVFEALPDVICAKDRESRFIVANPTTARLMGAASPDDLIGRTDADFYPPHMAEMFRREEAVVLGNGVVGPVDQEVVSRDGSRRWQTSMKTPLLGRHGDVVGIIVHVRDNTDRKKLESDLMKTQGYLQEAMNNMADGLVLYDEDGTIRFCNEQYAKMFPKTADLRVEGSRFADIIRASVERGEEAPKADIDTHVAERVRLLPRSGERLIELQDGRSIELRSRLLAGKDTLVVFTDVTAKKQIERELQRRASQDPLTGLANRSAFKFELDATHRRAAAGNTQYAVLMLDLDRFKPVNDTHGHAAGDMLLIEIARRLRGAVRDGTLAARLGGDEFAFIVRAEDVETATVSLANRVVNSLRKPFQAGEIELSPSGSLGIAYFPQTAEDPFELLRCADKALYAVKARGGGAWAVSASQTGLREPVQAKASSAA